MLNIDRNNLLNLTEGDLKKQHFWVLMIATLLLIGGILCLVNPFASGIAISVIVGTLFLLSGISVIIAFIASRRNNFWPMAAGIFLGIAYLILGYIFVTNPVVGILTMSLLLAILFAIGGGIRLVLGFNLLGTKGAWLQIIVGILDLFIAAIIIFSGPAMSIALLTAIIGIEMLFSSFACFQIASFLKSQL